MPPPAPGAGPTGQVPSLHLVRHAPTRSNAEGVVMGGLDVPAEPVADPRRYALRPAGRRILTSPLQRARTAVSVLFPGEAAEPDPRLVERSMGELEGLSHAEVRARWPQAYGERGLDTGFEPPGGETMATFARRVLEVLQEHAQPDVDTYLVTHNGWIRTALFLVGEVEPDDLFAESVPFLVPVVLDLDVDGLRRAAARVSVWG